MILAINTETFLDISYDTVSPIKYKIYIYWGGAEIC
jgi:hypothetical protein